MFVKRSFTVDTLGMLLAFGLSTLLSLPTGVLIARFLGPDGKGVITLVVLVMSQLGVILSLGVEVALVHFGGRRRWNLVDLASTSMGLGIILGIISWALAVGIFVLIPDRIIPGHLVPWVMLVSSSIPLALITGYIRNLIRVSGRVVEEGALCALASFLNLVLISLALILGFGIKGALVSLGLSSIVVSLFTFTLGWKWEIVRKKPGFSPTSWRSLVVYGLKLHVGSVFQTLNYRFDMYLVAFFVGSGSVGLYSVAVSLGEWLWLLPTVLGAPLMQRVATSSDEEANRLMGPINRLSSLILITGLVFLAFVGKWLIPWLYGEPFRPSYFPLLLLLPGIWAMGLWKNLTNDLSVRGYPGSKSYTSAVALLLTVLLDILLIPRWGISGAAIASSIAYLAAWGVALNLYCRITHYHPSDLLITRQEDLVLVFRLFKNGLHRLQAKCISG